jgi:hypothetical protein
MEQTVSDESGIMQNEVVVAYFKVLPQYLATELKKIMRNLSG